MGEFTGARKGALCFTRSNSSWRVVSAQCDLVECDQINSLKKERKDE